MANLQAVLNQLRSARGRAQAEVQKLNQAIAAIEKVGGRRGTRSAGPHRRRRRLSAAARKRMSRAQRVRWAKVRQQQKKSA